MLQCPKCGSPELWDNRSTKRNPKAPDFKCKRRDCDGAVWMDRQADPVRHSPFQDIQGAQSAQSAPPPTIVSHAGPGLEPVPIVAPEMPRSPKDVVIDPGDVRLMGSCLAQAALLLIQEMRHLDVAIPGNDVVFHMDNICSVASTLFIETRKSSRG